MAVLSFVAYALSAIWLTPYLFKHLGAAAFGLVPIAQLFTQYVSIITANLSGAVNRFLTVELQKPDGNPVRIFNSSLALYAILVFIQLPIFFVGIQYADDLFSIPAELRADALLLLGFSAGGFLLSLIGGVFGVSIYSKNRLDISASVNLARLVLRLVLIVVLFTAFGPKLRFIGYIDFVLNVLMLTTSIFLWRKFTPELVISPLQIDLKLLRPIFNMSIWTIINQFGSLLYLRSDIWIINRFISPVMAGVYAAVLVVANFIRQLANLFSGQFGPVSMSYWAKGELDEMCRVLRLAIKVLSISLAIPVAFLLLNGSRVLGLWLGPDFSTHALLLGVLCIHLPLNAGVIPLFQLQSASNTVRVPALVTFAMGVLNVVVSYLLGVTFGMGAIGVAMATAIVLTMKNALFTPYYAAVVLKKPVGIFFKPLCSGILMLGLVWLVSWIPFYRPFGGSRGGWPSLLAQALGVSLVAVVLGWILVVSKNERCALLGMLPEKIKPYARKLCFGDG